MLPTALTGQAMSIVNKSLETGARGQSQKITDYSTLSDAFFKKATLDAQIGNMLMDNQMQRAQLMADIDMNKASMHMEAANLALRDAHFQQARQDQKDADKMSPFEKITGVLAGAAQGAVAGQAIAPGKAGAIGGAVVGGLGALGAGNSRRAQSNTLDNIGMMSNAAVNYRKLADGQKAKDAAGTWADTFANLAGRYRAAEPGSPEQAALKGEIDNHIAGYSKVGVLNGENLQQIADSQASLTKMVHGYDPLDPKQAATMAIKDIQAQAMSAGDEGRYAGFNDPNHANFRNARDQFLADVGNVYSPAWGKSMSESQAQAIMGSTGTENTAAYFGGAGLSAMPKRGGGGGQISSGGGSTGQGVTSETVGTTGRSTMEANAATATPQTSQIMPIVPGSPGVIAPSPASQAWGMTVDRGPEHMLADAQTNFAESVRKDPTILDQAMNRDPEMEQDPARRDRMRAEDRAFQREKIATKIGEMIPGKDNAEQYADSLRAKRQAKAETSVDGDEAPYQPKMTKTGTTEPNITSEDPKVQKQEYDFKTITSPDGMKKAMGMEGKKFGKQHELDLALGPLKTAADLNKFEKDMLSPENRAVFDSLPPEAKRELVMWAEGWGEGAMEGSSKGAAVSGTGASAQINWSNFERSNRTAIQEIGERHNLNKKQMSLLNQMRTRVEGLARDVGMAKNKGQLTGQDVAPWRSAIANLFEQDAGVATSGLNSVKDDLWSTWYFKGHGVQSVDEAQSTEIGTAAAKQEIKINASGDDPNDPVMIYTRRR